MRVTEFKTKIDLAREMLDVLKGYFRVSMVVFDSWYWSEKLVKENVVSELKSNRAQGRVGPGDPQGGGGTPPSGIPPGVYYADLTLGAQAITVKLLVREHKRDSGTHVKCLYTTDPSLSEDVEEAWRMRWKIEDLQGTSRPLDWRTPRSGGGRGFRATSRSSPSTTSSGSR